MLRRPHDRIRGDFRLVDRRHRLRGARQPALHPVELRRVHRRQVHRRHVNAAAVVKQLAAERFRESLYRVLRAAIGRLERDAAVRERRSDLHNRSAIARQHPFERCERAVDDAEIRHLGDALDFVGLQLLDRREHRHHRVVDPDVDGAELTLDALGRRVDLRRVGDVDRQDQGASSFLLDFAARGLQSVDAARDEADRRIAAVSPRERAGRRAANARRGARDDDGDHFSYLRRGPTPGACRGSRLGSPRSFQRGALSERPVTPRCIRRSA